MNYYLVSKKMLIILQFFFLVIWSIIYISCAFLLVPDTWLWYIIIWTLRILLVFITLIYLPLVYKNTKYKITKDMIIYERGVFINKKSIINIDNIKMISLISSPFTKIFKISSIIVSSAGASLIINFLDKDTAEKIVEILSIKKY